jgi:hypothetical protein
MAVAVGVAGEFASEALLSNAEGELRIKNNEIIVGLQQRIPSQRETA